MLIVKVDVCYDFISNARTCSISLPHPIFPSVAEWTTPSITGDIPPPLAYFSLTQISVEQALMHGGHGPGGSSSVVRVATVSRDSVVSVCK